ncbi:UNVERIFIED_CONTAM: Retrovirus-related Pol polyprotein from transposon TNT 1-94 [Sesamum indicum]
MQAPGGYAIAPTHVCHLRHSPYDLKQTSRQWNLEFTLSLEWFGFHQSSHDHWLFIKGLGSDFIGLLVYMDDVLIMVPTVTLISQVKAYLDNAFSIKDLGSARYFLGLQIACSDLGTSLSLNTFKISLIVVYN